MNVNLLQSTDELPSGVHRGRKHSASVAVEPNTSDPESLPPPPARKKILLADDDSGVLEMLGRVLQSENYEVIPAKNGNEATAKFVLRRPDLVLLDLNMPLRDGWSAFRFMDAARPLVPVIIITARPNQYPLAEQLGVDGLMEKPLNLPVLLDAIKGLLAETESDRTRRLTNPRFQTAYFSHPQPSPGSGQPP